MGVDDEHDHRATLRKWPRLGVTLVAATVLVLATACEPAPPRPTFTVTTTDDAPDAQPGDGICEATVGEGDCSLRAAIDEANAVGRATITVPLPASDNDHWIETPLTIASGTNLHILGERGTDDPSTVPHILDTGLTNGILVEQGADLLVSDLQTLGVTFSVEGNLVARRATLQHYWNSPTVDVAETGTAVLWHSFIVGDAEQGVIDNSGSLLTRYSLVTALGVPAVHTGAGATTTFTSTLFDRQVAHGGTDMTGTICTGAATVSGGYNHAVNATCDLDQPTDVQDGDPADTHAEVPSWVDRIPAGEIGCGELDDFDMYGSPRPMPYLPEGESACDIGPWEVGPWEFGAESAEGVDSVT